MEIGALQEQRDTLRDEVESLRTLLMQRFVPHKEQVAGSPTGGGGADEFSVRDAEELEREYLQNELAKTRRECEALSKAILKVHRTKQEVEEERQRLLQRSPHLRSSTMIGTGTVQRNTAEYLLEGTGRAPATARELELTKQIASQDSAILSLKRQMLELQALDARENDDFDKTRELLERQRRAADEEAAGHSAAHASIEEFLRRSK